MQQKLFNGIILAFQGGLATIKLETGLTIFAKPKGKFRYHNSYVKPLVGDNVEIELNHQTYVIIKIYERTNALIRPQCANIDEVLIIQSVVEPNLNPYVLTKFLAHYEARVELVSLCFTKLDLLSSSEFQKFHEWVKHYQNDGYQIYFSNDSTDIEKIKNELSTKKVCLVGNSGVGKSTLLNKINPNWKIKTQEISKALNRGKHTTTSTTMIPYEQGMLLDTPGFSSIDVLMTPLELASSFHDFRKYAPKCKFSNCLHDQETGCYIKQMVDDGKIYHERYENYLQILKQIKTSSN